MVFFNYATMQMAAKIVYYGPGLCGKTTNLHWIYGKTSPQSRGEMVSLETETDRTLFFDLLPIDVGVIGGFKTRLQLYTIPGQVFYNTTRKLVLKGVDGLVFVADSQRAMIDANRESFKNLHENLKEIGLDLKDIPLVIQLNKRDLPNVADKQEIIELIDPEGVYESVEASAVSGVGVFETLKQISKLTLRTLRKKMMGEEPARTSATLRVQSSTPQQSTDSRTRPVPAVSQNAYPPKMAPPPAPSQPQPMASAGPAAKAPAVAGNAQMLETMEDLLVDSSPIETMQESDVLSDTAESVDSHILSSAPVAEVPAPASPASSHPEPEVNFSQTRGKSQTPEVKHVKVRSTVDIMAELESLRKKATQTTPRAKREITQPVKAQPAARAAQPAPPAAPRGNVSRDLLMQSPSSSVKARHVRMTVGFEDEHGQHLGHQQASIDLEKADIAQLLINLKVDFPTGR